MKVIMKTLKRFSIGTCLGLSLLTLAAQADWKPNAEFGLGRAGDFAVLSLGKVSADAEGIAKLGMAGATIHGDVGVGSHTTLDFRGAATINGDLYIAPNVEISTDNGTLNGTRYTDADLSGAITDAIQASAVNKARPKTQVFKRVETSMILYGNGGMNVINMKGLDYSKSSSVKPLELTLKGGPDDLFVLNITDKFDLGSAASIRGVGIEPSQVLVNILEGMAPVRLGANSYVGGTLLSATSRKMGPLMSASGAIIGGQAKGISLVSGAVLNPPPTAPIAVIGADTRVSVGTPVQLDGSASTASLGGDLTYSWTMLVPAGSVATLCGPTAVSPYFTPDVVGDYVVQLVVHDGSQDSDPAVATITAIEAGEGVDLSLQIAENRDPVTVKTELIYTLTVTNKSTSSAEQVRLNASLLDDVKGTPVIEAWTGGTCSYSVGNVTCSLDELAGGATVTVKIIILPKKAGDFHIEASVNSLGEDPDPSNNEAAERTGVTKQILN